MDGVVDTADGSLVVVTVAVVVAAATVGSVMLISDESTSLATVLGRPVTAMPASRAITAIATTSTADFTAGAG